VTQESLLIRGIKDLNRIKSIQAIQSTNTKTLWMNQTHSTIRSLRNQSHCFAIIWPRHLMKMSRLRGGPLSMAVPELYHISQTQRDNHCLFLWKQIMNPWILRMLKTISASRLSLLKIKSALRYLTSGPLNSFMQEKLPSFIISSKAFKWFLRKNNNLSWNNKSRYQLSKKSYKIFKTRLASWWLCRWNTTERGLLKRNKERLGLLKQAFSNHLHPRKYLRWFGSNPKNLANHQIKSTLTHVTSKQRREYGIYAYKNTRKMRQGTWVRKMPSLQSKWKNKKVGFLKRFLYSRIEKRLHSQ
jgi:hypothetical protein